MVAVVGGLFTLVVVDFLGACVGGVIGNRTDDAFCRAMDQFTARLHDGGAPLNSDVRRAVRRAYLQAMRALLQQRLHVLGVAPSGPSIWLQRLRGRPSWWAGATTCVRPMHPK